MLSFNVTERALVTGNIHVELCGGGIGAQDLIASGAIPGDITLQLMSRLRAQNLEKKECFAEERDGPIAFTRAESAAIGAKVAVGVRLFATADGGDVGVCTLNLIISPDQDDHVDDSARKAIEDADRQEFPSETRRQTEMGTSAPSSATPVTTVSSVIPSTEETANAAEAEATVAAPNEEQTKRHMMLLEKAGRHIETIEEVQFPRTHNGCGLHQKSSSYPQGVSHAHKKTPCFGRDW